MTNVNNAMEHVDRYEIAGIAGEGAMATVYRAHDIEIGRTVAIKVLKENLCVDEEYLNRFLREAKAAGALSHPNIVTIFDVGRAGVTPYITMEFLEGETLSDVLSAGRRIPLKQTIRIGIALANALDYAHRRGVVHRDMKPGNILLMPGDAAAKIADFGIARMDSSDELQKTQAGMVLGTPRYMSPEQARGEETDGRTDLFSVGVILYELLSGRRAFDASTVTSLLLQITQSDPEPIRKVAPNLPVGLRRIVTKLLDKKPEKRFQNGAELSAALTRELEAVLEQEQEHARNKYVPLKVKWAAAMGGIVALVMLVSTITVFRILGNAITAQSVDEGSSLAKFIANETAVPVLSEDWIRLETFVDDASERDTFEYLVVTDHTGAIKATTEQYKVGDSYALPQDAELVADISGIRVTEVDLNDETTVFNFDTPILFQGTEIGRINLGRSRASLDSVMSTTRWLMFVLALITITAVVAMLYVFGAMLTRPIAMIKRSMLDLGTGDFDQRISVERNDEIGDLFEAFNKMAENVQGIFGKRGYEMEKKSESEAGSSKRNAEMTAIGIASLTSKSGIFSKGDGNGLLSRQTAETLKILGTEKLEDSIDLLGRFSRRLGSVLMSAYAVLRDLIQNRVLQKTSSVSDVPDGPSPDTIRGATAENDDLTVITRAPGGAAKPSSKTGGDQVPGGERASDEGGEDLDSTVVASRIQKD